MGNNKVAKAKKSKMKSSNWQFWLIIALPCIYALIFAYVPMGGILMAFEDYSPRRGFLGSDWVGLKHFTRFLTSTSSVQVIKNTLILGAYNLIVSFPIPVILAVCINEIQAKFFKKTVQMVTYAPYFISIVVLCGMLFTMTDLRTGIFNILLGKIGIDPINFTGSPETFRHLYVWSGVWQTAGYSAIIYIAALAGVSPELKEAAVMDGASRIQRILHVDIPCIMPTLVIMLIMSCGNIINIGFDKVYLLQNPMNASVSEVISTFVYKVGITQADYGFSTAAGLFQSVVSFVLLVSVNQISKKVTDNSLW
ncbi:MAG: ABC transporter permease subunit [Eubacteriales bacterium]|nr:ABC transporter permease subunit [Eubacteriales bacterium]